MNASLRPLRMSAALSRRAVIALSTGLFVLFAIVASSALQAGRNATALESVRSALASTSLLQDILLAVEDCETGQRGFLLTSQDSYLTPFEHGLSILPGMLDELARQFPTDQATRDLRESIEAKLAEMSQTVERMRAADRAAALAIVKTDVGRKQMLHIRELVLRLSGDQQAAVATDMAGIKGGGQVLIGIDGLGLVAVTIVAGIISLGWRNYVRDMSEARVTAARAYEDLSLLNQRLDDAVQTRTADLTAANDEIQRFAYIVSHDLRSPLVNIMGFTSELDQAAKTLTDLPGSEDWPEPARVAATQDIPEALRFIRASTSKMDRLINAILKLSRDGRRSLVNERLDMNALVEGVVESMRHQAVTKDVEISVGPLPSMQADRIAIEQIFGNLIDNALKYLMSDRPGQVAITAGEDGAKIRFSVVDNGRGIVSRDYERIFELFRRSGDQNVPGEGIGLTHVRALVRRLGGSIDCLSTVNVGTLFTVTFPRRDAKDREQMA